MVKAVSPSNVGRPFNPWLGAKISRVSGSENHNIKQKRYCKKLSIDFQMAHIKQKNLKKA